MSKPSELIAYSGLCCLMIGIVCLVFPTLGPPEDLGPWVLQALRTGLVLGLFSPVLFLASLFVK